MTGFESLSGDMLSTAADKFGARDFKKDQAPTGKAGEKASKAFGSHLNRLAQEQEFKSVLSKVGAQRTEASRVDARTFVLPSASFDDRALTAASAKIAALPRLLEDAEPTKPEILDDIKLDSGTEQASTPVPISTDTRPQVSVLHAAMGFVHQIAADVDSESPPAQPETEERSAPKQAVATPKLDDIVTRDAPTMPSEAVDVAIFSLQQPIESPVAKTEHSTIRAPMPTKVAVVGQETHFEPALPSATLQQIVNAIGEEMPVQQEAAPVPASVATTPTRVETSGPTKTLTLQLDPVSLGTVTVKMKLTGAAIDVQIAASRPETAQLLEHDRSTLSRLLQASGYDTDVATIQVQSAAATASNGDAGQSAPNFQGQSGQSSAQGQFDPSNQRAGDQRPGPQQNQQERRQFALPQEERHVGEPASRSGTIQSGTLYL